MDTPNVEADFDFASYVARKKSGVAGERGEGYAYEGDLKVLRKMRTIKAVEVAVSQTVKLSKRVLTGQLLGTAVRVSSRQFPRIHRIVEGCARELGIPTPNVYVVPNIAQINAMTYGTEDEAFIIVHAATVDMLDDAELRFVIGHECGHIQNNHVVYLTTLRVLQALLQASLGLLGPVVLPATMALSAWSRSAEVTCDRAGLLCCGDPDAATRAFAKLAVGSLKLFDELDVGVYLEQLGEMREGIGRVAELQASHPFITRRIEALRLFSESALYRRSVGLDGGMAREELERRTEELIKVL